MPEEKDYKGLSDRVILQLARAEDYKVEGDNEKALQILRKILQKNPACIPAAEEVVDNLISLQDFVEGEKVANFVLSKNKESYIAHYSLGFIALTNGNNEKAFPYLEKANILNPSNPEILRCLGWATFNTGNKLRGLVTLERALNLRNDDPLILCDLGVCLLHEHVFKKAIELFEQALALEPENFRAQECLQAAIELESTFTQVGAPANEKGISIPTNLQSIGGSREEELNGNEA